MGKDLKGKELGTGISQRKDGYYVGRFTGHNGRKQKIFAKLQECKKWVADSIYEDKHRLKNTNCEITLDEWYQEWITITKKTIRSTTFASYEITYIQYIKPYIGEKQIHDISAFDCQKVLNAMGDNGYKSSSILKTKSVLKLMLESAVDNELILKNPCTKKVKSNVGISSDPRNALTLDEQKRLLEIVNETNYANQYRFILQTGIRAGELIALQWSDVDFKNNILNVRRTAHYRAHPGEWDFGDPKTDDGKRTIPLTQEAVSILQKQKIINKKYNTDIRFHDFVFLSKKGTPILNQSYDVILTRLCKKYNLPRISLHILRHTFATRCIEAGMQPKTLQKILGHSNISITMNLYVHVMEDQKQKEIKAIEQMLLLG